MTQLRDLLDEVAESRVPDGLARRAVADASHRRRQRFVVGGAVASVAAIVLAFVVVVEPFTSPSPELITPATAAPFPAQLPSAKGLPPLSEAPMSAASAAYVVDGEVVLVNAATAEAVTAFASDEDIPPSLSGSSGATRPSITGDWSSVALSPDGRMLLMTIPRYVGTQDLPGQLLYLLDIGAGTAQRLQDLLVADDEGEGGWTQPQLLAWSPASDEFACVCAGMFTETPQLQTYRVSDIDPDGRLDPAGGVGIAPAQITWGADGIAVQLERATGTWSLLGDGEFAEAETLDSADLLALALEDSERASVSNFFSGGESAGNPVTSGPAWNVDIDDGTTDLVPDRPPFRGGTAVAVSAVRGGYLVAVRPRDAEQGEPPPPTVLDVAFIDPAGNTTTLTQLPLGATSPSFAGHLISPSS